MQKWHCCASRVICLCCDSMMPHMCSHGRYWVQAALCFVVVLGVLSLLNLLIIYLHVITLAEHFRQVRALKGLMVLPLLMLSSKGLRLA